MKLTELLSDEIVREAALTRRVIERVPEGRDGWKPHDKSMPMGRLATLVATMPAWIAMMLDQDELDLNPPGGGSSFGRELHTVRERVDALEDGVRKAGPRWRRRATTGWGGRGGCCSHVRSFRRSRCISSCGKP